MLGCRFINLGVCYTAAGRWRWCIVECLSVWLARRRGANFREQTVKSGLNFNIMWQLRGHKPCRSRWHCGPVWIPSPRISISILKRSPLVSNKTGVCFLKDFLRPLVAAH